MKYDAEGNPIVKVVFDNQIFSTSVRINTTTGELQLKNRTTNLWHDIYIENNADGDATLSWDDNPGEA